MPGRNQPFLLSRRGLRRFKVSGPMFEFLDYLARRDSAVVDEDFNIKALDTTNRWTVANGATATTWAVRAEAGGWIRGVTGTTAATSGLQLSIPQKYWTGTSGALFAIAYKLSAITEIRFEAGFVDALPAVNTTVVNNLATPTFNTTASAALWVFDHATATTTAGLYTDGSGVAAQKAAVTTRLPTADALHFVAIEVRGTSVRLWAGDQVNEPTATLTGAITAADGLIPVVSVKGSDTTSKNVDIDLFYAWSGRLG